MNLEEKIDKVISMNYQVQEMPAYRGPELEGYYTYWFIRDNVTGKAMNVSNTNIDHVLDELLSEDHQEE